MAESFCSSIKTLPNEQNTLPFFLESCGLRITKIRLECVYQWVYKTGWAGVCGFLVQTQRCVFSLIWGAGSYQLMLDIRSRTSSGSPEESLGHCFFEVWLGGREIPFLDIPVPICSTYDWKGNSFSRWWQLKDFFVFTPKIGGR